LIAWLKERAEAGNRSAAVQGVRLLEEAERYDEAIHLSQHAYATARGHEQADLLLRAGRVDEAIAAYRQVAESLDVDPWITTSAQHRAAQLLRDVGRTGEAIDWLKRQAAAGRDGDHWQLVQLLKENGQTAAAITWLEEAARAGDVTATDRLAELLEETGHLDEAIGWLKAGAKTSDYLRSRLANMLEQNDRLDEAIILVLGVRGDEIVAARLLHKAGRLEEAITVLSAAGPGDRRTPAHIAVRSHIVESLLAVGRAEKAIAWLKDAGDWDAIDRVTNILSEVDRLDEAIALLKLRAAAGDKAASVKAANMLRDSGRGSEIVSWAADETDAGWYVLMKAADWLRDAGRLDEAIAFYQRAASVAGGVGTAWPQAAHQVMRMQESRGRVNEAIGWLKAQADAGEVEALDELARLLYNSGRVEEALIFFGRAIESSVSGLSGRLPIYVANMLCSAGYGEWVNHLQRYGIEPGGRPSPPWPISDGHHHSVDPALS
jgi:tetratricopeptide (TPR) repeat protein